MDNNKNIEEQYRLLENPLKIMYTIGRNLCVDESRRTKNESARKMEEIERMDGLRDKGIVLMVKEGKLIYQNFQVTGR